MDGNQECYCRVGGTCAGIPLGRLSFACAERTARHGGSEDCRTSWHCAIVPCISLSACHCTCREKRRDRLGDQGHRKKRRRVDKRRDVPSVEGYALCSLSCDNFMNVLFLPTGNSCRAIQAEATFQQAAGVRYRGGERSPAHPRPVRLSHGGEDERGHVTATGAAQDAAFGVSRGLAPAALKEALAC